MELPIAAVQAIYAQETGQGMMLPKDNEAAGPEQPDPGPGAEAAKRSHLRVIK